MKLSLKNTVLVRFFDPQWMWAAVHPSSMGLVRAIFGLLMIEQTAKTSLYYQGYLVKAKYLLHYDGFDWLEMLPADWLPGFFTLMYLSAVLVMAGFLSRPAMAFFFLAHTYTFLLDKGHYNNHYYMISLVSFWMIFTHWNHWLSLDNLLAKVLHRGKGSGFLMRLGRFLWQKRNPAGVPRWHLLVVQVIVFIVYFYGAVAKLNPDWLDAYPMRIWMEQRADWKVVGPLLNTLGFAYFLSYAGIVFDFLAAFILFSRRDRLKLWFFLLAMLPFHFINDHLWRIGVFPEMMLAMTILFFDPGIPARVVEWVRTRVLRKPRPRPSTSPGVAAQIHPPRHHKLVLGVLTLFFAWQFLFPLRVHFYPWPAEWHTNAQHFSWRMMLMDRETAIRLRVVAHGQTLGYIRFEDYVTQRQYRKFVKDPPEIVRFANHVADNMREEGGIAQPEIYATYWRSINGRPYQLVIDSSLNLVTLDYHPYKIQDWLLPFEDTERKTKNFQVLTDEEVRKLGILPP